MLSRHSLIVRRSLRQFSSLSSGGEERTIREFVAEGNLHRVERSHIRTFGIIAHIDHGKSTLADRLLELTGNVKKIGAESAQLLDSLKVERERGITVKAQSATMLYESKDPATGESAEFLLNLIDTPGHVDFSYEVTRSLSACDGVLLLVDAAQGIQAQTLATYDAAKAHGLEVIPVVTKIDLPNAKVEDTILQLSITLGLNDPDDVIPTSAKSGAGVTKILPAIVKKLAPPEGDRTAPLRARVIDSWYDEHRGVVCLVQVVDGCVKEQDRITTCLLNGEKVFAVQELGFLTPAPVRTKALYSGQVGYLIAAMRSTSDALLGDTVVNNEDLERKKVLEPLSGYVAAKPMIYATLYPLDTSDFDELRKAVSKLILNDASVTVDPEHSIALGNGLKCGFLGVLHMEVFHQRLTDEFDTPVLLTTPQVPYVIKFSDGEEIHVTSLNQWPSDPKSLMKKPQVLEPMVDATILAPADFLGDILEEIIKRRGEQTDLKYLEDGRILLKAAIPWAEVVIDFHDTIKNLTSGYATFNYVESSQRSANLVKVDMYVNGEPVDALSFVCHSDQAVSRGRQIAARLQKVIKRQQFEVVIQAKMGSKVLARERVAPYRKDVLTKSGKTVGGGDVTRKRKLLEKQKKGKARAKSVGKVELSQEAFWAVVSSSSKGPGGSSSDSD